MRGTRENIGKGKGVSKGKVSERMTTGKSMKRSVSTTPHTGSGHSSLKTGTRKGGTHK